MSLYLIRGLPGSGKSTFADKMLSAGVVDVVLSADDFMVDAEGSYHFRPQRLSEVHRKCQHATRRHLRVGHRVAVANTFVKRWEVVPYLTIASDLGVTVKMISVFDGGCDDATLATRNIHGVPLPTIIRMRRSYQHNMER